MPLTDTQRLTFEREVMQVFGAANRGKAEELMRLLGSPPKLDNVSAAFWRSIGNRLMRDLEPVLVQAAVASATNLGERASRLISIRWELVNLRAQRWAEQYTFEFVKGITENSRSRLSNMVQRFIGDGRVDLGTLSEQASSIFGEKRGQVIAVTEVTRAAAQGEAALVAEIREGNPALRVVEIWLTSNDELTCPVCEPRHGKRRGTAWNEPPPAHPNCRCAVATEFVGVGNG